MSSLWSLQPPAPLLLQAPPLNIPTYHTGSIYNALNLEANGMHQVVTQDGMICLSVWTDLTFQKMMNIFL